MDINKVQRFIEQYDLLARSSKTLVALSGGADSVALLRILLSLGYACEAAHCNFGLRGKNPTGTNVLCASYATSCKSRYM